MVLFWHRRDLRITDNAGLFKALKENEQVQPVFIFDASILSELPRNDQRVRFIHQEIQRVKKEYPELGSDLKVYFGNPIEIIPTVASQLACSAVYTNRDYEPYALERDKQIFASLEDLGISFIGSKDHVVFEKNEASKDFQLAEQLAKQENISIQEAQNFLTETVNEWKILIDKGESIELENIGSIKAEHDIWKLSPIAENPLDADSYGFSPIKLPALKTTDENLATETILETNEVANEETNESDNLPSKIVSWKERLLAKIKTWNWRNISIASVVFLIAYTFLLHFHHCYLNHK